MIFDVLPWDSSPWKKNNTIWELVPSIEQGSYGFTEFRSNLRHSVTQAVFTAFSSTSWYKVAPFCFYGRSPSILFLVAFLRLRFLWNISEGCEWFEGVDVWKSDFCDCDWWWVIGFWCTCWYRLMYTRDSYLGKRACISVSRWKPVSFSITTCPWCFGSRFRIAVIQSQPLLDLMCFSFSCVRYTWNPRHDGFECQDLLFIHSASGFGFTVHTWLVLQRLRYWPLTKARFYLAHISVVPESLEWCI